jgi:hypothetical protein
MKIANDRVLTTPQQVNQEPDSTAISDQAQEARAKKLIEQAHRQSVSTPVSDIAKRLQELLSRQLTAYIAGVKDTKSVTRWANGEVNDMRIQNERQLRATYEIVQLLSNFDSDEVVRAWFISLNPHLDDISPSEAINQGQLKEARMAARAFVTGVY